MAFEPIALRRAITLRLGEEALVRARRACRSKTLQESMVVIRYSDESVAVFVPHYWAIYYHEGSGPISGKRMAFFIDKADDPRTAGARSYPVRVSDIKKLTDVWTKEQIKAARKSGKLIFTTHVGPRGGNPFFEIGLAGFSAIADQIVAEVLTRALIEVLPREEAEIRLAL